MPKFQQKVVISPYTSNKTARVSDGTTGVTASFLGRLDQGKFVKLIADSQYGLCAQGNEIEGVLDTADDLPNSDGFAMGGIKDRGQFIATFDGLQATAGSGTIAVGDYVVCGSVTPRGTVLPGPPKVCKATAAATGIVFKWRVVSILTGSGAVGGTGCVEQII